MIKLKKRANYLVLAILSIIMVFTWTGISIYFALTEPAKIKVNKKQLALVESKFDLETLESLNQRLAISQTELIAFEKEKTQVKPAVQAPEASPSATEASEAAKAKP